MSENNYKKLVLRQRGQDGIREEVNSWIRDNINENLRSLQDLVMDSEAEFISELDDFEGEDEAFRLELDKVLDGYYVKILAYLDGVDKKVVTKVIDPTPQEPKAAPPDPVLGAITTLLNSSKGVTEERVREIIREEIANLKVSISA